MIFIYNFLFILIVGFILQSKLNIKKYKILFIFICFFQMFLFQALRDSSVGSDTITYIETYENYKNSSFYAFKITHFDIGIRWLFEIFSFFRIDSQYILVVSSLVIMLGFAIFIYFNSKNVLLSTLVFAGLFFPNSFNVIRQYMALAIAINALYFFRNKKYLKALIIILISLIFHKVSLILLIPMALSLIKDYRISLFILVAIAFSCLIFSDYISNLVLTIFRDDYYLDDKYTTLRLFRMTTILTVSYALFFIYSFRNEDKDNNEYRLIQNFSLLSVSFGILYLKNEIYSRFIEAVNVYLVFAFPYFIYIKKDKYDLIYKISLVSLALFLMIMQVFNSGSGVENYKFYF